MRGIIYNSSPGRYEEHFDRWSRADDERPRGLGAPVPLDPMPVAIDRDLSGEEAYQRRLALSRAHVPPAPPPITEDVPMEPEDDGGEPIPGLTMSSAAASLPRDESREDAYSRRLAMSPGVALAPVSPPTKVYEQPDPPELAYNPFAPPSVPPPPPGPPTTVGLPDFESRAKAAAAIAAKLSALANSAAANTASASTTTVAEESSKKCVVYPSPVLRHSDLLSQTRSPRFRSPSHGQMGP